MTNEYGNKQIKFMNESIIGRVQVLCYDWLFIGTFTMIC